MVDQPSRCNEVCHVYDSASQLGHYYADLNIWWRVIVESCCGANKKCTKYECVTRSIRTQIATNSVKCSTSMSKL